MSERDPFDAELEELRGSKAALQTEIERLKAEADKAWTKHLIEREELKAEKNALQVEIDRLRALNDEQQSMLHAQESVPALYEEINRLKAERHTVKQMLRDLLDKHGHRATT